MLKTRWFSEKAFLWEKKEITKGLHYSPFWWGEPYTRPNWQAMLEAFPCHYAIMKLNLGQGYQPNYTNEKYRTPYPECALLLKRNLTCNCLLKSPEGIVPGDLIKDRQLSHYNDDDDGGADSIERQRTMTGGSLTPDDSNALGTWGNIRFKDDVEQQMLGCTKYSKLLHSE